MKKFDKLASKICDCHVHFGQFREDDYAPKEIIQWFDKLGIDKVGIMPISSESNFPVDQKILGSLPEKRFGPAAF